MVMILWKANSTKRKISCFEVKGICSIEQVSFFKLTGINAQTAKTCLAG